MTLSAISNAALAKNPVNQQKSENSRSNLSSGSNFSEKKFDDTVTLSQSEKSAELSKVIDAQAVEKVLPRTIKAILQESKTAVAAQANVNSQAAQEFLAEN